MSTKTSHSLISVLERFFDILLNAENACRFSHSLPSPPVVTKDNRGRRDKNQHVNICFYRCGRSTSRSVTETVAKIISFSFLKVQQWSLNTFANFFLSCQINETNLQWLDFPSEKCNFCAEFIEMNKKMQRKTSRSIQDKTHFGWSSRRSIFRASVFLWSPPGRTQNVIV